MTAVCHAARRPFRTIRAWTAALVLLALPLTAQAAPASPPSGPTNLLIAYRCNPADRPAFRAYLKKQGTARFEALKQAGTIADYQIVFSWYQDALSWDAMAIVQFAGYEDVAKWNALEHDSPGGLDARGLALAQSAVTVSADLGWQEGDAAPRDSGRVLYVIPYEYRARAEYLNYVDGYVIPQVRGWMREGILARYRIFLNRYPVGPTWDALFVYEYEDMESFGKREATIAKVRGPLQAQPDWAALHATKQELRSESPNTIAEVVAGR
jgi:hypothetical protein